MTWPDAPTCLHCRHPRTKEYGRPMQREGAARHFDPTEYYFECNSCGRSKTVKSK